MFIILGKFNFKIFVENCVKIKKKKKKEGIDTIAISNMIRNYQVTGDSRTGSRRKNFTLIEHYKPSVVSTTMDIASSMDNHYISRECFEPTSMPSIMWLEIGICAYLSKANYIDGSSTSVHVCTLDRCFCIIHWSSNEPPSVESGMAVAGQSWVQRAN